LGRCQRLRHVAPKILDCHVLQLAPAAPLAEPGPGRVQAVQGGTCWQRVDGDARLRQATVEQALHQQAAEAMTDEQGWLPEAANVFFVMGEQSADARWRVACPGRPVERRRPGRRAAVITAGAEAPLERLPDGGREPEPMNEQDVSCHGPLSELRVGCDGW